MKKLSRILTRLALITLLTNLVTTKVIAQDKNNSTNSSKPLILAPIVVTATRIEQDSFDLPMAIDTVNKEDIQDSQLQNTLSESLIRLPGITAQNRNQQAQDPKISSRGFGSRASFGVRGIRLYVDGIPLTMPDGQGQPGVVDLSTIGKVEVMRGPFSSLYGNSSGGVIQMFTEAPSQTAKVEGELMFGTYSTEREIVKASASTKNSEYLLNLSNFDSDGYRDHSRSDKQMATIKFKTYLGDYTELTTLFNTFDQDAKDPSGLTKEQVAIDRRGVSDAVNNADTRVSRDHTQIGFNLEHSLNDNNELSFINYIGERNNEQILATNFEGSNARNSKISRDFYGTDVRWTNSGKFFDKEYSFGIGLNYGRSEDDRQDRNIQGDFLGLNRDEDNNSYNFDQYFQGQFAIFENLDLHAGLRHTKVKLKVNDHLISESNPDNSGTVEYKKYTPVVGVTWKINPSFNLYANYGEGFETPTFFEVSNNSTSSSAVPNLDLKSAKSKNYEIGSKAYITDNTQVNLNLFTIRTKDELVVNASEFGRTVYTNANKTKRRGAEVSIESEFKHELSTYFSYSLLDAKFNSDYVGNSGLISAGNDIPGTYHSQAYGEVAWKYTPIGFNAAFEGSYHSKVYVDDINSETAASYTTFNLRSGFEQNIDKWKIKEFVRVENIFGEHYIGSVRINDRNKRYYEPAADRNYLVGLSLSYEF